MLHHRKIHLPLKSKSDGTALSDEATRGPVFRYMGFRLFLTPEGRIGRFVNRFIARPRILHSWLFRFLLRAFPSKIKKCCKQHSAKNVLDPYTGLYRTILWPINSIQKWIPFDVMPTMNKVYRAVQLTAILFGTFVFSNALLHATVAQDVAVQDNKPDETGTAPSPEEEERIEIPNPSEFIPLAADLSGRLTGLGKEIDHLIDVSALEKKYAAIEADLAELSSRFETLKNSGDYRSNRIEALDNEIERQIRSFEETGKPLRSAIDLLWNRRNEWVQEKTRWDKWREVLLKGGQFEPLESIFESVDDTINAAVERILPRLELLLKIQKGAGSLKTEMTVLASEAEGLIASKRHEALLKTSPPMFSGEYLSQFGGDLWSAAGGSLYGISWPDSIFFSGQGWIVFIQTVLSALLVISFYRNRRTLKQSGRLQFLAARPWSAGLFLGYMSTILIYEYSQSPYTWKMLIMIIAAVSFVRLMGVLVETTWKRNFIYGTMLFLIVNSLLDMYDFPLPLVRLYVLIASLAGFLFCFCWAMRNRQPGNPRIYAWALFLGSWFFGFIAIVEVWGKSALPLYLFASIIKTFAVVLVFTVLMYILQGGIDRIWRSTKLLPRAGLQSEDIDIIIRRSTQFINILIWLFVLTPGILAIWQAYSNLEEATKALLSFGFTLGSQRITMDLLIAAAGVLYVSNFASWILERFLMGKALSKNRMELGVRLSIANLIRYTLIFIAFLIAVSILGFDITKLTIIMSALSVGIGFGLQTVVNNFVSGIILLFERPVRVGDTVELGGNWAEIKRIGLRATIVQTFDQADVIIPNSDLISNQVTNWTLSNRQARLIIPVGVAYGSDVPLVMQKLAASADKNPRVAKMPEPQVLFQSFGESSLNFELRVWVTNVDYRLQVLSELHQEIDRCFREANIEISFPQRDLHLRSVDESIITDAIHK